MSPQKKPFPIAERMRRLDWKQLEQSLDESGSARTGPVLTRGECRLLIKAYDDDGRFRSTISMERYRFGAGEYRYFRYPLPRIVSQLRAAAYPHLASIANRWAQQLRKKTRFPERLQEFLEACHMGGQTKPTPLLLRYDSGGYNCLHQDLYGDISFPLQMVCFLNRAGVDYGGGEFLLVEQRPRSQSRGEAITAERGEFVIFPNAWRPVQGKRGHYRVAIRHGASRVRWGSRHTLGIIFHDAR